MNKEETLIIKVKVLSPDLRGTTQWAIYDVLNKLREEGDIQFTMKKEKVGD